jgi:hypothetical protein
LPSLRRDQYWRGVFWYTIVTDALALAFAIGQLFMPHQISWFGLYERLLVANAIIWVEIVAIRLLVLSLRRQREARQKEGMAIEAG